MLNTLLKNKKCNRLFLRFFVWLDNVCYRAITKSAIVANGGVHPKHRLMNYHQFFVDKVSPEDTIIDVGCSTGSIAYDVAAKAKKVVGIDFNKKSIRTAQRTFVRPNLTYLVGDATTFQFTEKFSKIILSNVLEHIEHRVDFLKKMHQLSSVILLRVPLIDRDWLTLFKKEAGFEYRLDPTHFIEFTDANLRQELRESGWSIVSFSVQFGEFWGVVTSRQ